MLRRVLRDAAVAFAGPRALLVQAARTPWRSRASSRTRAPWTSPTSASTRTARVIPIDAERDAFWQDYKTIGKRIALRKADMPKDTDAFDAYLEG